MSACKCHKYYQQQHTNDNKVIHCLGDWKAKQAHQTFASIGIILHFKFAVKFAVDYTHFRRSSGMPHRFWCHLKQRLITNSK